MAETLTNKPSIKARKLRKSTTKQHQQNRRRRSKNKTPTHAPTQTPLGGASANEPWSQVSLLSSKVDAFEHEIG